VKSEVEVAFVGSAETPHLSQLMRTRRIGADLEKEVDEAKMKMDLDSLSADDESDEAEQSTGLARPSTTARVPVMRVPARAASASPPPASVTGACPESRRCRAPPPPAGLTAEADACVRQEVETPMYEDLMDVDLSPNTVSSNSAPSLVSDDGEYDDDSEGGSDSDPSEALEDQPMSDLAEINGDDDTAMIESVKPRPPPPKKGGKHVTFVQALPTNKAKRRRQA
jgi:ADA HAT complex component 1